LSHSSSHRSSGRMPISARTQRATAKEASNPTRVAKNGTQPAGRFAESCFSGQIELSAVDGRQQGHEHERHRHASGYRQQPTAGHEPRPAQPRRGQVDAGDHSNGQQGGGNGAHSAGLLRCRSQQPASRTGPPSRPASQRDSVPTTACCAPVMPLWLGPAQEFARTAAAEAAWPYMFQPASPPAAWRPGTYLKARTVLALFASGRASWRRPTPVPASRARRTAAVRRHPPAYDRAATSVFHSATAGGRQVRPSRRGHVGHNPPGKAGGQTEGADR